MKTLANCNPKEFLVQTNKIRRHVERWLSLTKILEIRKRMPAIDENATPDERRKAVSEQIKKNANDVLSAVMEEHPDETAELLGLLCFVDPEDLENHKMAEFFGAFTDIVESPEVIGFFTSLKQLGEMYTSASAKG